MQNGEIHEKRNMIVYSYVELFVRSVHIHWTACPAFSTCSIHHIFIMRSMLSNVCGDGADMLEYQPPPKDEYPACLGQGHA